MFSIKTENGLTPYFASSTGVKQGCILSPILSNLFQNDLHESFDHEGDPITLSTQNLNSISWADDLVIFSTTQSGLQKSLDKLQQYCSKWGLSINTDKTKCMLFSLGNAKMPSFQLNGITLENVISYKYLGIIMHKNGKFDKAIKDRMVKANRAIHMVKQILGYSNAISVKIAMSLFDKQIIPILLYGSPLWGIPDNHYIHVKLSKIDSQVKKQIRQIIEKRLNKKIAIDDIRAFREKNMVLVKLHNITDKIDLLYNKLAFNDDCTISDHQVNNNKSSYETIHSKFCKYTVNIPRHASTTGIFRELDRYPIAIKAWISNITYWHRLEIGTDNIILQNAFNECKNNNHMYYQNVQYLLRKNGLGHIFISPQIYNAKQLVSIIKRNLTDQHRQMTNTLISTDDKFNTLRLCTNIPEDIKPGILYKDYIKSPDIRRCFAFLRMDKAIKYNSTKQNQELKLCDVCLTNMDTRHIVIECKKTECERNILFKNLTKFIPGFIDLTKDDKVKIILNPNLLKDKTDIFSYVKHVCTVSKIIG